MKYKKKLINLKAAQSWFDALPNNVKLGLSRPGSVKQKTAIKK